VNKTTIAEVETLIREPASRRPSAPRSTRSSVSATAPRRSSAWRRRAAVRREPARAAGRIPWWCSKAKSQRPPGRGPVRRAADHAAAETGQRRGSRTRPPDSQSNGFRRSPSPHPHHLRRGDRRGTLPSSPASSPGPSTPW
jgi:hypothetical protein